MNPTQSRIVVIGIFFLLVFLTGFWLNRSAKPYGTALVNVHKLMALADFVLLVISLYWINRSAPLPPQVIAFAAAALVFFVGAIVTGGLVTVLGAGGLGGLSSTVRIGISLSHKILPFLTVLSTAGTLYLAMTPHTS